VKLDERVRRLELRNSPPDRRQIEEDARMVSDRLLRIASQFTPAAKNRAHSDLLKMSPAQHFAWAKVFQPDQADVRSIMRLHGHEMAA
jgi:hypothetical protein